jgi:hypothetical protein
MHPSKSWRRLPNPLQAFGRPILRPSRLIAEMVASNYPDDTVVQEAVYNAAEQWIFREQLKKLLLFAEATNADLTTLSGSFHAFLRLIESYPKALEVIAPGLEKRPGAPRKPHFKDAPSVTELAKEVDGQLALAKALGKPTKIAKICCDLSKRGRWRAYRSGTLQTYYYKWKSELQDIRRAKLGPTEYWKYLEATAENAKRHNGLLPRTH